MDHSSLAHVEKRGWSREEVFSDVLGCFPCRAGLNWLGERGRWGGGGGPGTLRGTCVRLGTLGLPALRVSVCGYFERGGSGLLTTSCPLEGR